MSHNNALTFQPWPFRGLTRQKREDQNLVRAAMNDDMEGVLAALEAGANLQETRCWMRMKNGGGHGIFQGSALNGALWNTKADMVKTLLAMGAKPDAATLDSFVYLASQVMQVDTQDPAIDDYLFELGKALGNAGIRWGLDSPTAREQETMVRLQGWAPRVFDHLVEAQRPMVEQASMEANFPPAPTTRTPGRI
jgi:hypothetical protein